MEEASIEDLARASSQGSILAIKVDGVVYGSGGFQSKPSPALFYVTIAGLLLLLLGGAFFVVERTSLLTKATTLFTKAFERFKSRRQVEALPASLREKFAVETEDASEKRKEVEAELKKKDEALAQQQDEVERLKVMLNTERVLRQLERSRTGEYVAQLEQQISADETRRAAEQAAVNHTDCRAKNKDGELC